MYLVVHAIVALLVVWIVSHKEADFKTAGMAASTVVYTGVLTLFVYDTLDWSARNSDWQKSESPIAFLAGVG